LRPAGRLTGPDFETATARRVMIPPGRPEASKGDDRDAAVVS